MAGGKSLFNNKPEKNFFEATPKVQDAPLITDEPATGPKPVDVVAPKEVRNWAAVAATKVTPRSVNNSSYVAYSQDKASTKPAATTSSANTWASIASAPAKESAPAKWKEMAPRKSSKTSSRKASTSSDSAMSSSSSKSTATSQSSSSTKEDKPAIMPPKVSIWPAKKVSSEPGNTIKIVVPIGRPASLPTPPSSQPSPEPMTAAARRAQSDAELAASTPFAATEKTVEPRKSTDSPSSVQTSESTDITNPVEHLAAVPKPTKKATSTPPAKKASPKPETTIKLVSNGGSTKLASSPTPSPRTSKEPAKSAAVPKKSYSEVVESKSSTGSTKASMIADTEVVQSLKQTEGKKDVKPTVPFPVTAQQLIPTENKSKNKNKKKVVKPAVEAPPTSPSPAIGTTLKTSVEEKSAATIAVDVPAPKTGKTAGETDDKVELKKVDQTEVVDATVTKNVAEPVADAAPAALSEIVPVIVSAEKIGVIITEDAPTPPTQDATSTETAQDVASQPNQQHTSTPSKKTRKNKKSGGRRKIEKKKRTPEQEAAIRAHPFLACIDKQIAQIQLLGEQEAAQRKLPVGARALQQLASQDTEDIMNKNKQLAEKALRKALLANVMNEELDRVDIHELPGYLWFQNTCAQPLIQKRAKEMLEGIQQFSFGVGNIPTSVKPLPLKQEATFAPPTAGQFEFWMAATSTMAKLSMVSSPMPVFDMAISMSKHSVSTGPSAAIKTAEQATIAPEDASAPIIESRVIGPAATESIAADSKVAEPELAVAEPLDNQLLQTPESANLPLDTDDASVLDKEPSTTEEKNFVSLPAPTECHDSFLCGNALVLAVVDEEPSVDGTSLVLNVFPTKNISGFQTGTATGTTQVLAVTTEKQLEDDIVEDESSKSCVAMVKYYPSLITGTEMVLSTAPRQPTVEESIKEKADKPSMAVMKYHGSLLPIFNSTPPVAADTNPIELSRNLKTSGKIKAVAPFDVCRFYEPIPAPKNGFEIMLSDTALIAFADTLRDVPDGLQPALELPDAPTHEPATRERAMTVFTPPRPVRARRRPHPYRLNVAIGAGNLREFLNALPDPYARSYSRMEIVQAWITQTNVEREILDIGPPIMWTAAQVERNKTLQTRVRMGYINLEVFLRMMEFDEDDLVTRAELFRVFEDCSEDDEVAFEQHMRDEPL